MLTEYQLNLAPAHTLVEAAFSVDIDTTEAELTALYPKLTCKDYFWTVDIEAGEPPSIVHLDVHLEGMADGTKRVTHVTTSIKWTDPARLPSIQSSIAAQIHNRLGKATNRAEAINYRRRTWELDGEIVCLLSVRTMGDDPSITYFILQRTFEPEDF